MKTFLSATIIIFLSTFTVAQSKQSVSFSQGKLDANEKQDWFNLDYKKDKVHGTSTNRLYEEIIKDEKPKKKIVVAIIDSGVEIDHEDLNQSIWTNNGEVPGNGKDDDNNGYVDDVHGWNFLVDSEGNDIQYANLEATRVLRFSKSIGKEDYPSWLTNDMIAKASIIYNKSKTELQQMSQFGALYMQMDSTITGLLGKEDYTFEEALELEHKEDPMKRYHNVIRALKIFGVSKSDLKEMHETSIKYEKYYLNFDFVPREEFDFKTKGYGSNNYEGPDATHGTHVAGLVAANRYNTYGARGIASAAVEIMSLRAVPDGDERDEDVAMAIRYAVDNGANIINMSFGKGISPNESLVNEAIRYASEKNVLIVHAAGNDSENNDVVPNYPNQKMDGQPVKTYLTIGASTSAKNKKLVASFSNYGKSSVDLFAPGHEVYATIPDNDYKSLSGTSMAAPVASGVAALVWAYHPSLTAQQLKEILMRSATDLSKKKVVKPGSKDKVRFREICVSGALINAYSAFEMASEYISQN